MASRNSSVTQESFLNLAGKRKRDVPLESNGNYREGPVLAQSGRPAEQRSQTLNPQQSAPSFESNYACNRQGSAKRASVPINSCIAFVALLNYDVSRGNAVSP